MATALTCASSPRPPVRPTALHPVARARALRHRTERRRSDQQTRACACVHVHSPLVGAAAQRAGRTSGHAHLCMCRARARARATRSYTRARELTSTRVPRAVAAHQHARAAQLVGERVLVVAPHLYAAAREFRERWPSDERHELRRERRGQRDKRPRQSDLHYLLYDAHRPNDGPPTHHADGCAPGGQTTSTPCARRNGPSRRCRWARRPSVSK